MRVLIRSLVVFVSLFPAIAMAQPIVVVPKSGNGQWDVSYTRILDKGDATTGAELSTSCKTLAAAKQEAARLQRWSQSMDVNSDWRLKKIYIEGEDADAGPPKNAAPKTPSLLEKLHDGADTAKELKAKVDESKEKVENAKFAAKLIADPKGALEDKMKEWEKKAEKDARKLGDTLKEYGDNVADAYKRAKELKDNMLKMDKDLMEKSFKKVNDAIAVYNKQADAGAKFFDGKVSPFPKLKAVSPDTAKAVDDWKAAQKQQFDLEGRKEALDKKKADLDREREKLADEWKELAKNGEPDASDPKVVKLRDRLNVYRAEADKYTRDQATFAGEAEKFRATANFGNNVTKETIFYHIFYRRKSESEDWSDWHFLIIHPFDFSTKTGPFKDISDAQSMIDGIKKHNMRLASEFPNAVHIEYEYKVSSYDITTKK